MKILDLAAGSNPYFLRYNLNWEAKNEYYYFDSDFKRLKIAKEKISKASNKPSDSASKFIIGDSASLPFDNSYFDQIIISNFLSAPIHWQWDEPKDEVKILSELGETRRPVIKQPEQYDLFYNERKQSVSEALRVLKPGGRIYLFTDLIVYGLASYLKILNELKSNPLLKYKQMLDEQERIDALNLEKKKIRSDEFCICFTADVLPNCEIYEFTNIG